MECGQDVQPPQGIGGYPLQSGLMRAGAGTEPSCLIAVGMIKSQNNRDWEMVLDQKQVAEIMVMRGKVGMTVKGRDSEKAMEMIDSQPVPRGRRSEAQKATS